ncbi:MAG: FHA domain-containing protein, partial [Myxococcaceae bacterium]
MPPRKSISSRAEPASRRGKPRPNEKTELRAPLRPDEPPDATDDAAELPPDDEGTDWEAPPGKMSREQPRYETGSNYEAAEDAEAEADPDAEDEGDEPKSNEFLGDDALPASFSKDRDIYGEDDELPEDDDFSPVETPGARSDSTQVGRGGPPGRRTGETRVAPLEELEEEDSKNDSPDATRAGPPLKLEIVSGPDSGKSKMFKGVRMVIGRTAGCEWKLSDPSASRRHCELVVGDGGVLLRDLGSG